MMQTHSSKPNKQRFARFNADLHIRQHFVHAHISKELMQKLGLSKRSTQLHRGDTVKIMSGSLKGKTGKVHSVSLRRGRAEIEGITKKNARGKEKFIPISVSNLYIIDMDLSDKRRASKLRYIAQRQTQDKEVEAAPVAKQADATAKAQVQEARA
ncbi:MAG: 50S ribosomal protein L24 [Candidatus Micrarchaeaceae archaeon]